MQKHKKPIIFISLILLPIFAIFAFDALNPEARLLFIQLKSAVFKTIISDRDLSQASQNFSDLHYCNSDHSRQTLDLFLPRHTTESPEPLVIFIHGGGWNSGDKANNILSYYGKPLLERGFAVASINYRLVPEARFPAQNMDVDCAMKFLQNNASKYHFSESSWGIVGDSAGAQLGAYVLATAKQAYPIKGFVGFYGPYDLELQTGRKPKVDTDAINYMPKPLKDSDVVSASPYHLSVDVRARYLLYHGENDKIVSMSQSTQYHQKLIQSGASAKLVRVKDAGHHFSLSSSPSSNNIRSEIITFFSNTLN